MTGKNLWKIWDNLKENFKIVFGKQKKKIQKNWKSFGKLENNLGMFSSP